MGGLIWLRELSFSPFLLIFTLTIAFQLSALLNMAIQMIFARSFGLKIQDYEILGFKYDRSVEGKFRYIGHRPKIGAVCSPVLDLKKAEGADIKKIRKNETVYQILCHGLDLAISIGIFTGCTIAAKAIGSVMLASVVFQLGLGIVFFALVKVGLLCYAFSKVYSKTSLSGYQQSVVNMIRSGVPFDKMDLKSPFDPSFKNVKYFEKISYFPLYFAYLDATGKFDRMAAVVGDVENVIKPGSSSRADLFAYVTLVYFYSYHYIDVEKAKDYYHRAGDSIIKDDGANGLRIKGFYELNCFGNAAKAKELADQASSVIDSFSIGSEREYERKCIANLYEAISRFPAR